MKVLLLLLVAGLIAVASAIVESEEIVRSEWEIFKMQHGKQFDKYEDKYKYKVFKEARLKVAKHNRNYYNGLVSFKLGLNKYSDLFSSEIREKLNGFNKTVSRHLFMAMNVSRPKFIEPAHVELPDHVDWRKDGAVTPVKDQGHCGSCWAFSSTGALEGQHFRKSGVLTSLSEQNLIDCSTDYGNNGCNGGLMDQAFQYIKMNHGIDTEKSYPYDGKDEKCHYKPKNRGADDVGFVDIPQGDEEKLKAAVATVGPISVAIDASQETFQLYQEGVYDDHHCSSENLDHGVLVVGYGTEYNEKTKKKMDYWLVKNSWGPSWGDNGYIKMSRNKKNQCGIASSASYPLVSDSINQL